MFIIRPLCLFDIPTLAINSHEAYLHNPTFQFVWPHAAEYPLDCIRSFRRWLLRSYLGPQSFCLVACLASDPSTPLAHIQFTRMGSDAGAQRLARDQGLGNKIWLWILGQLLRAYHRLEDAMWPDRVTDSRRRYLILEWARKDDEKYWENSREGRNRWHVMNIVVAALWQGKGIGKMLMREVMARATSEMAKVGLEATSKGEKLYRSLGFEMLGDYYHPIEGTGGGIMAWYPEGWTRGINDEADIEARRRRIHSLLVLRLVLFALVLVLVHEVFVLVALTQEHVELRATIGL